MTKKGNLLKAASALDKKPCQNPEHFWLLHFPLCLAIGEIKADFLDDWAYKCQPSCAF